MKQSVIVSFVLLFALNAFGQEDDFFALFDDVSESHLTYATF